VNRNGNIVTFKMAADSFLPHQVRNTVGALIKVGQGKMTAEEFCHLVAAGTPGLAGPTAPAAGLCLERVDYPVEFKGDVS
jgi:tRNA pseudouridine38-40 synthase